jgi:putative hydrolase of the HAD superfamily
MWRIRQMGQRGKGFALCRVAHVTWMGEEIMPVKAVIFDRDGVLTNFDRAAALAFFQPRLTLSLEEIADRWADWGEKVGFPRTLVEEKLFFQEFWNTMGDELNLPGEIRRQLQQFEYTSCMRPLPDARPMLLEVRQRGMRTGVLSNFSLASLPASLVAVNLADLVDVACAATVIGAAKPAPEAYLTASRALGVQPEECLFFDDEIVCVEGGRAVGMRAYLVDRQRTHHAIAEGVVRGLTAISQILA